MRRGTIFVVLFIVLAAAVIGASQFLRSQPPMEISLAVSPLAEAWVRSVIDEFNNAEQLVNGTRRVRVNITVVEDSAVWQDEGRVEWNTTTHPDAWLPASMASVSYAVDRRMPFEIVVPSTARTVLVWGGYVSRVDAITNGGAQALDWAAVAEAAATGSWSVIPGGQASWQFFKLAFDNPTQSINGLGVLLSGAAAYADTTGIRSVITDNGFRTWFQPVAESVPNFNTLGADPAAAIASRGASVADIALLPENRWLENLRGLTNGEAIRLSYPAYDFVFDFPLARWEDANTSAEQREAVTLVGNWLSAPAQQTAATTVGLRPANGTPGADATLFTAGEAYGIVLEPDLNQPVEPPTRTEAQRLLQWFNTVR